MSEEGLTTKKAYFRLMTTGKASDIADKLKINVRQLSVQRVQLKNGTYPSIDLMEKRLKKAGYLVLQEKEWLTPIENNND